MGLTSTALINLFHFCFGKCLGKVGINLHFFQIALHFVKIIKKEHIIVQNIMWASSPVYRIHTCILKYACCLTNNILPWDMYLGSETCYTADILDSVYTLIESEMFWMSTWQTMFPTASIKLFVIVSIFSWIQFQTAQVTWQHFGCKSDVPCHRRGKPIIQWSSTGLIILNVSTKQWHGHFYCTCN